ncbi:MAG: TIGR00341 family protein [Deltaproteobacteria bacterium]|nr:MAG: TIGR00341 family protein [Deltaproteobacteria bacterium]
MRQPFPGWKRRRKRRRKKERRSIEEIYQDIEDSASLSKTYLVLVILASIVAAIGILYNDVAIVMGSMVIAPLLNPNIALALSTTLAESNLAKKAILTSIIGYMIAFSIGVIFGMLMRDEANAYHVISRSNVTLMYILLALSAGITGSLSVTKGVPQALVGVMVAVALLPLLVAGGLLAGSMQLYHALGAILLFMVNVVCINLAGVVTFLAQGITPRKWWEKERRKKPYENQCLSGFFSSSFSF